MLKTVDSQLLPHCAKILASISARQKPVAHKSIFETNVIVVAVLEKFASQTVPSISVLAYLRKIYTTFYMSDQLLITVLIYFERLLKLTGEHITSCQIHRLIAVTCIIAVKYHCDLYYSNAYYAKMAGIQLPEFNKMEFYIITLLDFKLEISENSYTNCEQTLYKLFRIEDGGCIPTVTNDSILERECAARIGEK